MLIRVDNNHPFLFIQSYIINELSNIVPSSPQIINIVIF